MTTNLDDDMLIVQGALDALDVYDRTIAAGGEGRDVELLHGNRRALADALQRVGDRGGLTDLDRVTFRRHTRITAASVVFPVALLPDSLPPYRAADESFPVALRHSKWERWMKRLDAQTADRVAWCALHGVEDPVDDVAAWIPDEPFDPDDV